MFLDNGLNVGMMSVVWKKMKLDIKNCRKMEKQKQQHNHVIYLVVCHCSKEAGAVTTNFEPIHMSIVRGQTRSNYDSKYEIPFLNVKKNI